MPQNIWAIEWLNSNSQRRYPLAESSSGIDTSGSFQLPSDFLVEIDLPISAGQDVDPSAFFVYMIGVYATGFSIIVGYQPASGDPISVASALVPQAGFVPNTAYVLGGIGDFSDSIGKLVVGRLDGIAQQPAGLFTLTLANGRIEPDCVRPIIRGVTALIVASGTETSEPLYGDVELVADENIQLVPIIVDGQDPQIRISAIQGEGLAQPCECVGDDPDAVPVLSINGIPPTSAGDFTVLGSECLTVTGITNGIQLTDTCSQPCCGCQELETVTRALENFGGQATTLGNFMTRLEAVVEQMDQVVLGSKLNDQGCFTS